MAVDRATVLRQQQLLDQAMQQAGNNPVLAESLSRNALLQSGLEFMKKAQAEEIAKGGRARELALRQGSFEQRMQDANQRLELEKEAFAEGQRIRNIAMALNVASTLGAQALPMMQEKPPSKAIALAEELEKRASTKPTADVLRILEKGTEGIDTSTDDLIFNLINTGRRGGM